MKKLAAILTLSTVVCSSGIGVSTYFATNNVFNSQKISSSLNEQEVKRDKTPIDYYGQTPVLTQKTGPIISYGSKISALDWYGSTLWSFDFRDTENHKYYPGNDPTNHPKYTNRAFINWSLDNKTNKLWVLTNSTTRGNELSQNIIAIDSVKGTVLDKQTLVYKPKQDYQFFYQIQVLSDGKVQIYSQGNSQWGLNILYDPIKKEQKLNNIKVDSWEKEIKNNMNEYTSHKANGQVRMLYLVPIKDNVNIAVFCDYNHRHLTNQGTSHLFLQLVDNNLQKINVNQNSPWNKMIHIPINVDDPKGTQAQNFSKTIYTTIDGKVYFTAWNKFFVFYPDSDNNGGIKYAIKNLPQGKRVLSYTMDVNENVYIKYWDDTHIYKLTIGGNSTNTTFDLNTYYDISSSNIDSIKNNADKFVLYNVTGYSGSIMLLSSRIINDGNFIDDNTSETVDKNYPNYGIAAAIVPNIKDPTGGDSKGLLNTEKSFLKTSDFTINADILGSKMPSEITKNDVSVSNGFFTNNKKVENNELVYPAFKISNIDDTNGTFTVTANIDQIPWFTTTLPNDAIPKTITKKFIDSKTISQKTSWKNSDNLSYDFKNTLPTELTQEDIDNFDPFQVSFSSQTVINNGNVIYPKKIYRKTTQKDDTGDVIISVDYKYVPLGVTYKGESDVITYTTSQNYKIFSKGNKKAFYFAGAQNQSTSNGDSLATIDIKTVPQLKALSQSNLLPSSFNGKNKEQFLQFINTNKSTGYPISKMTFDVEANDSNGTLTVIAKKPSSNETFRQLFSGFNMKNNYCFGFKTQQTSIDNKSFATMLPSSINEGDIIDNLVNYSGFNSSDFTINLFPNDTNGSLKVDILLNRDYTPSLGNGYGFSGYKASHEYSGFMNTEQYNNKYNVSFKANDNKSLVDIKKNALDKIYNQLKENGTNNINVNNQIQINGQTYKNLNDLIQKVFIDSKGSNIPKDWSTDTTKIKSNIAIDNQAGTMNLSISIDKSVLNGYDSNLNYVVSYSGFSRGNIEVTNDTFTFIEGNLLSAVLPTDVVKMKPSELGKWLKEKDNNISNIRKIIFNSTGQYEEFLNSGKYELEIEPSDVYKTLTVTIKFTGELNDKKSLKEYSIQYKLAN